MVLAACHPTLRKRQDVEDAFQNTFLALARGAGTIERRDTIGPRLYRVAFREAKKARRREWRERACIRTRETASTEGPSDPPDLSFVSTLREEVNRLPER